MPKVLGKRIDSRGKIYIYENIAVLAAKRTPFGKFKGKFSKMTATDLAVRASQSVIASCQLEANQVDQVIYSNTIPTSNDNLFLPRHIALKCGLNINTLGSLAQRICASGLETVILAANDIGIGASKITLAGGAENMTRAPLASFDTRTGFDLGQKPFADLLWEGLMDTYCGCSMGQTAENLAKKYNITRQQVDEFAVLTHNRAIEAKKNNAFCPELISCGELDQDETIRDSIDIKKISKLKPVFVKDGIQTAANSSLIADGAVSMLMSNSSTDQKPLGYIKGACVVGVEPEYMGISPAYAIRHLLKEFNLGIDDIDLFEINEAFGAQYLACEKELELDRQKVNILGGSIAIGHPLAATGGRLIATLMNSLGNSGKKLGIASACVGGGQGTAVLVCVD